MQITDLTQTTTSAAPAGKSNSEAGSGLTSDFETFLRMLTVQMQNQDPLNPLQSTDFAVQLATFSGVEQQLKANDLLSNLASELQIMGLGQAANWVGMEARTDAAVNFSGAPIELNVPTAPSADTAQLVVIDGTGKEVSRLPTDPAGGTLSWAGVAADGLPFPPGLYQFRLEASANGAPVTTDAVTSYATVTEVRVRDGQTVAVLSGGAEVPASGISALRMPGG